ncbi:Hypothetical_protein [Hexamita inflata]|uniref:Hypothetical_protein n=1 Tax=Hexamita inflata TaxID=28002 RepID=A0AA86NTH8_9EUKA|nr:Hypothetical protein HINF_LOCUS13932 [Hexamita inflata]
MQLTDLTNSLMHEVPLIFSELLQLTFVQKGVDKQPVYEFGMKGSDLLYKNVHLNNDGTVTIPQELRNSSVIQAKKEELNEILNRIWNSIDGLNDEELEGRDFDMTELQQMNAEIDAELKHEIELTQALNEELRSKYKEIVIQDLSGEQ